MSKEDFDKVLARARTDPDFARGLARDFSATAKFARFNLDPNEVAAAKHELQDVLSTASSPQPKPPEPLPFMVDFEFLQEMQRKKIESQVERMIRLGNYTASLLETTLDNARQAYFRITWMNTIMFISGMALLIFAALYAAFSQQQKIYSLVFGGLGIANFVTLFITRPVERTQAALSNLVQVEVAFMNYFEQITIWDAFASQPKGNPPALDLENIQKASATLQERSRETIELLQRYVEDKPIPSDDRREARSSEASKADFESSHT
jgi:hypothetical protein